MTVATLFTYVRYQISDELKTSYTDTELLTYLNQTNNYVYTTLIIHESNLTIKKVDITLTDGEGSLPSDFQSDSAVKLEGTPLNAVAPSTTPNASQYSIMADTIYSDNDSITLYYHFMPDDYAVEDTLTIPRYFENMYIQMVKFLVMNTDEYDTSVEQSLLVRFESLILTLVGKRGTSDIKAVMPFGV